MKKPNSEKLETTLGDLIAAASEVAFEYSNNDLEAYKLARLALVEILRNSFRPPEFDGESEGLSRSAGLSH